MPFSFWEQDDDNMTAQQPSNKNGSSKSLMSTSFPDLISASDASSTATTTTDGNLALNPKDKTITSSLSQQQQQQQKPNHHHQEHEDVNGVEGQEGSMRLAALSPTRPTSSSRNSSLSKWEDSITDLHRNTLGQSSHHTTASTKSKSSRRQTRSTSRTRKTSTAKTTNTPLLPPHKRKVLEQQQRPPLQRSNSVPMVDSAGNLTVSLGSFIDSQKIVKDDDDDDGEDSTIEESWRPNPSKRRSFVQGANAGPTEEEANGGTQQEITATTSPSLVMETSRPLSPSTASYSQSSDIKSLATTTMAAAPPPPPPPPPATPSTSLNRFLDSLIFETQNYHRNSPGANYRKRAQHRKSASTSGTVKKNTDLLKPMDSLGDVSMISLAAAAAVASLSNNHHRESGGGTVSRATTNPAAAAAAATIKTSQRRRASNEQQQQQQQQQLGQGAPPPKARSAPPITLWARKSGIVHGNDNDDNTPPDISNHRAMPVLRRSLSNNKLESSSHHNRDYNNIKENKKRRSHRLVATLSDSTATSGMLSAFLDRESRHERKTSAHTVGGDPRARGDTISIAISADGGASAKTFQVAPKQAKMIQRLLEEAAAAAAAKNKTQEEDGVFVLQSPKKESRKTIDSWTMASPLPSPQETMNSPNFYMSTPSGHDQTVVTQASTIDTSDHVSTRSSLIVELSPPLVTGPKKVARPDLTKYFDTNNINRRSRGARASSAFTVAGDRVSVRFQGKSTSELVELLREEKQEQEIQRRMHEASFASLSAGAPVLLPETTDRKSKANATQSGAHHSRTDLDNVAFAPDWNRMNNAMHESIAILGHRSPSDTHSPYFGSPNNWTKQDSPLALFPLDLEKEEGDDAVITPGDGVGGDDGDDTLHNSLDLSYLQSPNTPSTTSPPKVIQATRAELQSFLDGRSPNTKRRKSGAHSVSGDRVADSDRPNRRLSASPNKRQGERERGGRPSRTRGSSATSRNKPRRPSNGNQESSTMKHQPASNGASRKSAITSRERELEEFRSPGGGRPTNRRSLMRKMQSVPILNPEPKRVSSVTSTGSTARTARTSTTGREVGSRPRSASGERQTRTSSQKPERSNSDRRRNKRQSDISDTESKGSKTVSNSNRRGGKRDGLVNKMDREDESESGELELEDLQKSFLDKFLDGEVEGHDSASQMQGHKEEYKASLLDGPVENSLGKLRVDPSDILETSTSRLIVLDPTKSADRRSSEFKRGKSVTNLEKEPSPALIELYDPSPKPTNPKTVLVPDDGKEQHQDDKILTPSTKKGAKKLPASAKKTPTSSTGKKKKSVKSPKKKSTSKEKIELVDSDKAAAEEVQENPKPAVEKTGALTPPEKVTLQHLPRQRSDGIVHGIDIPDTSGHVRLVERLMHLSSRNLNLEESPGKLSKLTEADRCKSPDVQKQQQLPKPKTTPVTTKSSQVAGGRWVSTPDSSELALVDHCSASDAFDGSQASGWTKMGVPRPPLGSEPSSPKSPGNTNHCESKASSEKEGLPLKPMRKLSRPPDAFSDNADSTPAASSATTQRQAAKPGRLPPVSITEGSVLEVAHRDDDDDMSACSDITDNFSWEPLESEYSKRTAKRKGLGRIDEKDTSEHGEARTLGGTSWADLSLTDGLGRLTEEDEQSKLSAISRDKRMHLSKRWQSTPALRTDTDTLRSPARGQEGPTTPGRFSWIKKKLAFKKKAAGGDTTTK